MKLICAPMLLISMFPIVDVLSDMDQIVRSEFALESAFAREGHDAQGDPARGSFGVSIYGRRQDHATLDIDVWKVPANKITRFWAEKMGSLERPRAQIRGKLTRHCQHMTARFLSRP